MRVLIINFEYPPIGGGASPVTEQIAKGLHKFGHKLSVLTMAFGDLKAREDRNGIKIYRIASGRKLPNMSRLPEHLRFINNGRSFLKKHLESNKYDIVYAHFLISSGILAFWVFKKYSIPYILTPHGSDIPGYNPDHFKLMHFFTPLFLKKIILRSKKVTVASSYLAELMITKNLSSKEKLLVVPNGIELLNESKSKPCLILSTGRLLKRKGFHQLIQAVKDEKLNCEVHIAGDGPMMPALKKLAKGSKTKIVLHGWLENKSKEYQNLIAQASIYCLVSSFENASVSILEAMSAGCAVITSNGTGCAEMVADSGILVDYGDVQALKIHMKRLVEDKNLIHTYGQKAKTRVKNKFLWNDIIKQYDMVLRDASERS